MKYVSDLQLFSKKLCKLMKDKGMTYKNDLPDPVLLYNAFYPHDQLQIIDKTGKGFGRSEYSEKTRKFDNWIKGKAYPKTINDMLQLCNALDCDLDYFFTDMECSTHDFQFIHDKTGLSEDSIKSLNALNTLNEIFPGCQDEKFDLINLILQDAHNKESFSSLLDLIVGFCRFTISAGSDDLYTVDSNGITKFQAHPSLSGKGISYNPLKAHFHIQDMESMYYLKIWDAIRELKEIYKSNSYKQ